MKKQTKNKSFCIRITEKMYLDLKRLNLDVAGLCREALNRAINNVIKETKAK